MILEKRKDQISLLKIKCNDENPHDRLPPEKSANIIISHVTDGVNILKKYQYAKGNH